MSARAKRIVFSVRYNRARGWDVYRFKEPINIGWVHKGEWVHKDDVIRWAERYCRDMLRRDGTPSELIIYDKNGKIGRGSSSLRSYGADPRRSKG